MQKSKWLSCVASAALTTLPVFAQGGDDCANATVITGNGMHAFDQTLATFSGQGASCAFNGLTGVDVWFEWTAPQTAPYILSLCGQVTHDTVVAIYSDCAGTEEACNDDACNLISEVNFNAVVGSTYFIQVATWNTTAGDVGSFTINPDLPLINPANGHAYKMVSNNTDWLTAKAEAENMMFNGQPGYLATFSDQAEIDWVINNLPSGRPWIGAFHDAATPGYAEPDMGWAWVTGEPFTFTNWNPGEPNNNSGSGGAEDYAEMFGNGEWNDAELNHTTTTHFLVEWGGAGLGTPFCDPMDPNSTGLPTELTAAPSMAAQSGIHLEASQGPFNQFGYFLIGTGSTEPGLALGNGRLCLAISGGNSFGRYNVPGSNLNSIGQFDASGILQNSTGTSSTGTGFDIPNTIPISGSPQIQAGETWHFQLWHREAAGTSNFSNGLSIQF